jgi:hypothetical protein
MNQEQKDKIHELENQVDILHQDGDRWRKIAQDLKRDLDHVRNENVQLLQRVRFLENLKQILTTDSHG